MYTEAPLWCSGTQGAEGETEAEICSRARQRVLNVSLEKYKLHGSFSPTMEVKLVAYVWENEKQHRIGQ